MSVQIDLELLTKQFQAGIDKATKATDSFAKDFSRSTTSNQRAMRDLANSVDRNSKSISSSFNVASAAAGVFLGQLAFEVVAKSITAATSAIFNFGQASLSAAVDAEETRSKFSTVFNGISQDAQETAANLSSAFGLGSTEAQRLLGDTGDLLTGFGFTQSGALELSNQVQELAVDLASFTNFSGGAEGASAALTKALLGERESVKALGISIQEKDVQEQIAINRANGLTFASERQAKAQATLDIAIRQSSNAIGDYARTSDSAANQQRLFATRITDIQEAVGRGLVPAFQAGLGEINKFIASIDPQILTSFVADGVVTLIEGLVALSDSINPVINAFKFLGNVGSVIFLGLRQSVLNIQTTFAFVVDEIIAEFQGLLRFIPDSLIPDGWEDSINTARDVSKESLAELTDDLFDNVSQINKGFDDISNSFQDSISEDGLTKIKSVLDRTKNAVISAVNETQAAGVNTPSASGGESEAERAARVAAEKEVEIERNKQAQLSAIREAARNELAIVAATSDVSRQELGIAELEALQALETAKLEITRNANLAKLKDEQDTNKRILGEAAINQKFAVDSAKLQASQSKELRDVDAKNDQDRVSNRRSTLNTIAQLSRNNNKTLAQLGKAAAITTATQDGFVAVNKALASAPPPFNFALAALVGAATAANVANIVSAGNFATGGVIPGTSTAGDRITANVNSGEMILNRRQQTELFNQANGSGSGSSMNSEQIAEIVRATVSNMNVTLVANDNEIARSASRGAINGVVIGVSE